MIPINSETRKCKNCTFPFTYSQLNGAGLCAKCHLYKHRNEIIKAVNTKSSKTFKPKPSNELTEVEEVALEALPFLSAFAKYLEEKGETKILNRFLAEYSKTLLKKHIDSGMNKKSNK